MIRSFFIIITVFLTLHLSAQKNTFIIPDTLEKKDYDYLFERIEESPRNSKTQILYLKSFLWKAKTENNLEETMNGYKNYVHYSADNLKLVYADSMISTAKITYDNSLIGSAYLSKGIIFYGMKKHKYALDNYLIANQLISQTDDDYLIHKIKYNIANIKYYLGYYNEAISLFKECMDYFKKDDVRPYLNSIHLLGLCYNKIGNYGLCTEMNQKGLAEGKRLSTYEMNIYFIHSEGINQYFKSNYRKAIGEINSIVTSIRDVNDFGNESVGYFYIGASYWKLSMREKALPYLMKVDKIFQDKDYIRPDLIKNYELLIEYYKSKNNLEKQLYYTKRLLKADSILDNQYQYLSKRIHKDYDTKKIMVDMKKMEYSLELRKYNDLIFTVAIIGFILTTIFLLRRNIKNKKKYRENFMKLMEQDEDIKSESKVTDHGIADISQDTVLVLLKKLEKFEKNKKYLEKDVTLSKLAVSFNTNINYLYKIIYHHSGKKFTDYINDLKIDYIINLMKNDKTYQKYTNKALADEIGFSSTQRFAKAFYARTGMPVSYFIKSLEKNT